MFCNACGTENNNSAAYCSACGAKLANNHAPVKSAKASQSTFEKEKAKHDAQTELAQMIYGILKQVEPQTSNYNQIRSIGERMERIKAASAQNDEIPTERKLGYAVIAAAIATIIFFLLCFPSTSDPISAAMAFGPFLIPAAAFYLAYRAAESKKKRRRKKFNNKLAACKEEARPISAKIVANYNSIPDNFISFEYADPGTLYMMYQIVSTGRADTLKEAILYFDELCHRQKMEDIALQQLNVTRQIFDQTIEIRKSIAFIESMSGVMVINTLR